MALPTCEQLIRNLLLIKTPKTSFFYRYKPIGSPGQPLFSLSPDKMFDAAYSKGRKQMTRQEMITFHGSTWYPDYKLAKQFLADQRGFIITDTTLQTSQKDVYAVVDIRAGAIAQVSSAAGEEATAV